MKRWSNTCKLVLGLLVVVGLSWQTVFRTISAIDGREGDSRKRAMQVTVKVKFREGENTNAHEESSVGSDQSSSELDSSISGHIDIAQRAQFSKKFVSLSFFLLFLFKETVYRHFRTSIKQEHPRSRIRA